MNSERFLPCLNDHLPVCVQGTSGQSRAELAPDVLER